MSDDEHKLASYKLGDKLERLFITTGISQVVSTIEKIANKKCKCDERKEMLNKLFDE